MSVVLMFPAPLQDPGCNPTKLAPFKRRLPSYYAAVLKAAIFRVKSTPTSSYRSLQLSGPSLFRSRTFMTVPLFLRLSEGSRRNKFAELNELGASRVEEGIADSVASPWAISEAIRPQNFLKNRYSNIFPWDRTRVKLLAPPNADFINASHVSLASDHYIAAQGPLDSTIHHFWAMAYHQLEKAGTDTIIVAMVTPLVELGAIKCAKYWPTKTDKPLDLSPELSRERIEPLQLTVEYVGEQLNKDADFVVTELALRSGTKTKRVFHFYYYKWADAKVPPSLDPLLALSRAIRSLQVADPKPIVPIVHCSAGVGRSGTFIAIDHLANSPGLYDSGARDPVFETVLLLRADRMTMVQTVYQYNFLYESLGQLYEDRN